MKTLRVVKKLLALGLSALLPLAAPVFISAQGVTKEVTLADYPFPFINQGQFDGKIVVGKRAAASDVIGAVDISASLQAEAVEEVPIQIPNQPPPLEGDAYDLTSGRNMFEFREGIREVLTGGTVGADELESLKSGTINSDQGNTQYNQYLRFGSGANGDTLSNWTLYYGPNDDPNEKVGDFLFVPELQLTGKFANLTQNAIFEYELEFQDGLRSVIKSRSNKLELKSIEQKVFNIFGTDFTLSDTTIRGTSTAPDLTLSFMGGDVVDTLEQGETKVYTIDGVDYEITAVFLADPRNDFPTAKFSINGELTAPLQEGDVDVLSQGIQIGVQSVLVSNQKGMVIFYLGANKLELRDNNTVDTDFFQSVRAGSEKIDGGFVRILGDWIDKDTDTEIEINEIFRIDHIQYRFLAKSVRGTTNIYVPPDHGIREFLDKPQGMLNSYWDIKYNGLLPVQSQPIRIAPYGDNEYRFIFTNQENLQYNVPLIENVDGAGLRYGRGGTQSFIFNEPNAFSSVYDSGSGNLDVNYFPIKRNDYFLVSNAPSGINTNNLPGASAGNAISKVLQYESVDTQSKRVTFKDLSQGTQTVPYLDTGLTDPTVLGTGTLNTGGGQFVFYIANFTNSTHQFPMAIDVDGDGRIEGDMARATVFGRGVVSFSNNTNLNQSNITGGFVVVNISTHSDYVDSGGTNGGENLEINLTSKPGLDEIDIQTVVYFRNGVNYNTLPSSNFRRFKLSRGSEVKDHATGATDYGAIVDQYTPGNDVRAREIIVDYPATQRGGQVLITGGQKKKSLQDQQITTKRVNPIPVGFSVLDTDAPLLGRDNMIVIGGPCANRVAAELLGNPEVCGKGFSPGKAIMQLHQTGDKFALLIAGYDSMDTLGASYVVADFRKYGLVGREMEVMVKDLDHIVVTPIK